MRTWQEVLGIVRGLGADEGVYGPHSREIVSAVVALQKAIWYKNVGRPSAGDAAVVRVASWDAAWAILDDRARYNICGTLKEPLRIVTSLRDDDTQEAGWWRAARDYRRRAVELVDPPVDDESPDSRAFAAADYIQDYVDRLLEEIIVQDHTDCTYFREQLPWLAFGYFPCGWDGDWPTGKLRIF